MADLERTKYKGIKRQKGSLKEALEKIRERKKRAKAKKK